MVLKKKAFVYDVAGKEHGGLINVARIVFSSLLIGVIVYIGVENSLSKVLHWNVLVIAVAAATPALMMNAFVLKFLVSTAGKKISFIEALRLATLSVLGNSLGVPVGSGIKYYILHFKHGVNPLRIMTGNFLFAIIVGMFFLAFSLVIKLYYFKSYSFALSVLAATGLFFCVVFFGAKQLFPKKTAEAQCLFATSFSKFLYLSVVVFLLYLWWYGLIIYYCFNELDPQFVSGVSLSLGLGLASGLASVAGYQELAIAYVSNTLGIQWYRGAELALVYRFTALISSLLMLMLFVKKLIATIQERARIQS